jgi:biopolymer transport protein ExbB
MKFRWVREGIVPKGLGAAMLTALPETGFAQGQGDEGAFDLLPTDLSPWGMFLHADIVVKVVIVGLAVASVVTWTIWLAKTLELFRARRQLAMAFQQIRGAVSLGDAAQRLSLDKGVAATLVQAAQEEMHESLEMPHDREGLKECIALRLERIEVAAGRRMIIGTGILATIGSTAPFVGLFGTVWGIMNSFVGISKAHTSNLAVVAPGIAEALLATAIGLVAAIPAVVIYNHFARQINAYKVLVADTASFVLRLALRNVSFNAAGRLGGGDNPPGNNLPGGGNALLRVVTE